MTRSTAPPPNNDDNSPLRPSPPNDNNRPHSHPHSQNNAHDMEVSILQSAALCTIRTLIVSDVDLRSAAELVECSFLHSLGKEEDLGAVDLCLVCGPLVVSPTASSMPFEDEEEEEFENEEEKEEEQHKDDNGDDELDKKEQNEQDNESTQKTAHPENVNPTITSSLDKEEGYLGLRDSFTLYRAAPASPPLYHDHVEDDDDNDHEEQQYQDEHETTCNDAHHESRTRRMPPPFRRQHNHHRHDEDEDEDEDELDWMRHSHNYNHPSRLGRHATPQVAEMHQEHLNTPEYIAAQEGMLTSLLSQLETIVCRVAYVAPSFFSRPLETPFHENTNNNNYNYNYNQYAASGMGRSHAMWRMSGPAAYTTSPPPPPPMHQELSSMLARDYMHPLQHPEQQQQQQRQEEEKRYTPNSRNVRHLWLPLAPGLGVVGYNQDDYEDEFHEKEQDQKEYRNHGYQGGGGGYTESPGYGCGGGGGAYGYRTPSAAGMHRAPPTRYSHETDAPSWGSNPVAGMTPPAAAGHVKRRRGKWDKWKTHPNNNDHGKHKKENASNRVNKLKEAMTKELLGLAPTSHFALHDNHKKEKEGFYEEHKADAHEPLPKAQAILISSRSAPCNMSKNNHSKKMQEGIASEQVVLHVVSNDRHGKAYHHTRPIHKDATNQTNDTFKHGVQQVDERACHVVCPGSLRRKGHYAVVDLVLVSPLQSNAQVPSRAEVNQEMLPRENRGKASVSQTSHVWVVKNVQLCSMRKNKS